MFYLYTLKNTFLIITLVKTKVCPWFIFFPSTKRGIFIFSKFSGIENFSVLRISIENFLKCVCYIFLKEVTRELLYLHAYPWCVQFILYHIARIGRMEMNHTQETVWNLIAIIGKRDYTKESVSDFYLGIASLAMEKNLR